MYWVLGSERNTTIFLNETTLQEDGGTQVLPYDLCCLLVALETTATALRQKSTQQSVHVNAICSLNSPLSRKGQNEKQVSNETSVTDTECTRSVTTRMFDLHAETMGYERWFPTVAWERTKRINTGLPHVPYLV
jgi:hypothetical protein